MGTSRYTIPAAFGICRGRWSRYQWAWLPIPVLLTAIIGLWFADLRTPYSAPQLHSFLIFVFSTVAALVVASLFARGFLARGAPGLLLFGCGAVVWSLSAVLALSPIFDLNFVITVHNMCVWDASLCFLAGVTLLLRWPSAVGRRGPWLAVGYTLAVALVGFNILAARSGWTPVFFVQGVGGTEVRYFVLGCTIVLLILTAALLWRVGRTGRNSFLAWFRLFLLLLAVGLFGVMLQPVFGGLLGWVSRAAQYLGGAYLLVGAAAAVRETGDPGADLESPQDRAWYPVGIALAAVLVAATLRVVYLQGLGTAFGFLTFYPAVMLAALYGGLSGGVWATVLSALICGYYWSGPPGSYSIDNPSDWLAIGIFVSTCTLMSWLAERLVQAKSRLLQAEVGLRAQLEQQVAERTAALTREIVERRQAEERLSAVLNTVPVAVGLMDREGRWLLTNPEMRRFMGTHLPSRDSELGSRWQSFDQQGNRLDPSQYPGARALRGEIVPPSVDFVIEMAGEKRWLRVGAAPVFRDGIIEGAVAVMQDITEEKAALDALRASEARLRRAGQAAVFGFYDFDVAAQKGRWSPEMGRLFGFEPEGDVSFLLGISFIHPEDRERVRAEMEAIMARTGPYEIECRIVRSDGAVRWVLDRGEAFGPVDPATGKVACVTGTLIDITARKEAEERQRLLMREVDHRAKNALAVVQAVVRLTNAETIEAFVEAVDGRVDALARAHSLLARNRWGGVDLASLISEELAPFLEGEGQPGRLRLSGPALSVAAEAVQALGMVFHELATNAAKYGAISSPGGSVEIVWRRLDDGNIQFVWQEAGGPPVQEPTRRGFGSRMISGTVVKQLGGDAVFFWSIQGLRCEFTVRSDRVAVDDLRPVSPASAPASAPAPATARARLTGRRILVVEDDALIALSTGKALEEIGCTVLGPAVTLDDAMRLAATEPDLDAAVVDVNLRGRAAWPVAEILRARGVPFLFATGYGDLVENLSDAPILEKPLQTETLKSRLAHIMTRTTGEVLMETGREGAEAGRMAIRTKHAELRQDHPGNPRPDHPMAS